MTISLTNSAEVLPPVPPPIVQDSGLHECVRDLVALSTMPACWIGRTPLLIAEDVRDLLVTMLRPDSVYVQLQDRTHGRAHVATAHAKAIPTPDSSSESLYRDVSSEPLVLDSEVALGLASLPVGAEGELGRVAVGSSRPHFPGKLELLLMQVAANQVAVALRYTELLARHEKVEQELEDARAAAEKSSRQKSDFLGMMSHELRTPLNAIGGYVELMEGGIRGPVTPEQRADLGRIRRSQRHLLGVIENVLGYLKLGSGHVAYEISDVSIEEIVSNVEEITKPLVRAKNLSYGQHPAHDHLFARADHDKVQQIVLNLLSNAIKFTPHGGRVDIEWGEQESRIRIGVSDTGIGIPADRLQTVFEPFVQIDSRRARGAGGTGLGLSISREFAKGMDGQLLVESELGNGSAFTLILPKANAATKSYPAST